MSIWTEEELDDIWEQGLPAEGFDDELFRMDAAGALMERSAFGKKHRYGWLVDSPAHEDEKNLSALRPLFWKNHAARLDEAPRKFFRYHAALDLNVNHFHQDDI